MTSIWSLLGGKRGIENYILLHSLIKTFINCFKGIFGLLNQAKLMIPLQKQNLLASVLSERLEIKTLLFLHYNNNNFFKTWLVKLLQSISFT